MEPTERKDMSQKERLFQEYKKFVFETPQRMRMATTDQIFDFFYSEIESRHRLLEAADSLIDMVHIPPGTELNEALEKYQALKQQSKT